MNEQDKQLDFPKDLKELMGGWGQFRLLLVSYPQDQLRLAETVLKEHITGTRGFTIIGFGMNL